MTLMVTSDKGIQLIKQFEGCKLTAYKDSVGIPTIGYGHTKGVKMGTTITQTQAEGLLKEDLKGFEAHLNKMGINFKQNQFDALIAWIFNLGTVNFESSSLKRAIVMGNDDATIASQMVRWYYAGGKPMLGLKRRRVAEANMWLGREAYIVDNAGNIKKM